MPAPWRPSPAKLSPVPAYISDGLPGLEDDARDRDARRGSRRRRSSSSRRSTLFQIPPPTLPQKSVEVVVGWTAIDRTRPPMLPGPSSAQLAELRPPARSTPASAASWASRRGHPGCRDVAVLVAPREEPPFHPLVGTVRVRLAELLDRAIEARARHRQELAVRQSLGRLDPEHGGERQPETARHFDLAFGRSRSRPGGRRLPFRAWRRPGRGLRRDPPAQSHDQGPRQRSSDRDGLLHGDIKQLPKGRINPTHRSSIMDPPRFGES